MEKRSTLHPTLEVLKAFGLGKLDDSSSGALMEHLDLCADCRKIVAGQSGDDFLDRLRQAHGQSVTPAPARSLDGMAGKPKPPVGPTTLFNLPPELADNPQYEILKELGKGGMGVVYLAKNKLMDRLEVLKVINKALLDRPGAVERFLREIRAAAKLHHLNVVSAYTALQLGELLVFAMEYVEGQDLAAVVKEQGPLPVPYACFYVQQAAQGLQHAFEKGMVHRDIKPQNMMLAREGRKHVVKVLDFGLAKVLQEKAEDTGLTGEGKMLGTPDYMAPEQTLDAASADIRADIYSLGCTLYFLLSGQRPFKGKNLYDILQAHQSLEAPAVNAVRPEVPAELAAVVRRMMAKERSQRYQTPLEVVQALAPFVKQGATSKSSSGLSAAESKAAIVPAVKVVGVSVPAPPSKPWSPPAWGALSAGDSGAVDKRRSTATKPRAWKGWILGGSVAAGLLLVLAGCWLAVVRLRVETPNGTLVVEINDKEVEARIKDDTLQLVGPDGKVRYTLKANDREKQMEPGTYTIHVAGANGLTVDTPVFTIRKGTLVTVRVRIEKSLARKDAENKGTDRKAAEWVLSIGGTVRINDEERDIRAVADLPGDAFRLTHVNLNRNAKVRDADLAVFSGCRSLKSLDLGMTHVGNQGIAHLAGCKNLEFLKVEGTAATDLSALKGLPLTTFSCNGTAVKDLSPLKGMQLKWLDCTNSQVSDLTPLAGMNLGKLLCVNTRVSDLSPLKGMPLTDLECAGTKVADLSPLQGMPLKNLRIDSTPVADLSPLKGMKLETLNCFASQVTDLSPLKDMKLRHLDCNAQVTNAGLAPLQEMVSLRDLRIGGPKMTEAGLAHLKKLTDLERLDVLDVRLSEAGLRNLEGMTRLECLILPNTALTDEALVRLKGFPRLRTLSLVQTQVTDAGLVYLAALTNLTSLNLHGSRVTDQNVAKLRAALPKCSIER